MVSSSGFSSEHAWAQIPLCSASLYATIAQLQFSNFYSSTQAYKICILQYLALWAKEVFMKFEKKFREVFYLGRTEQTFSTQESET